MCPSKSSDDYRTNHEFINLLKSSDDFGVAWPVLFGCNKTGGCSEKDYVVVGIMGMIPTGTAYLITEKEGRKDSTIRISFFQPAAFETKIKGRQLTTIEFEKAKEILSNLPARFFTDDKTVYGCPNCADGGVFLLRRIKMVK